MSTSLTNLASSLEENLCDFLWREWSTLGITGTSPAETRWIIDPEVLLLLTSEMARHEARLFDEVLDWMRINSRWINTQRLRTLHAKYGIGDARVLSAVARIMIKHDPPAKWRKLSEGSPRKGELAEPLFRHGYRALLSTVENPDPDFAAFGLIRPIIASRSLSQLVAMKQPCALTFRLRALFGLGMRADILCYLLTHDVAHPSGVAQALGYSQKRVQDTLIEMASSGLVFVRPSGRMKIYWLDHDQWDQFLTSKKTPFPAWVNWPLLARGLTTLWRGIWAIAPDQTDDYVISSKMRTTMRQAQDDLYASGIEFRLENDRDHKAENYLPVFIATIHRILEKVNEEFNFPVQDGFV